MARVLIVEDEPAIAELLAINLKHAGFDYVIVDNADDARQEVDNILPDLVLLDWMLPGQSGITLAKGWRANERTKQIPIIMLTARSEETDKIQGLDAGADDYVVKPFSTQELLARIRALLRRKLPEASQESVSLAGLTLDPDRWQIVYAGLEVKLGPTEFKLLNYLMRYPNRVHSRSQLLDKVWGQHVFIEERSVDVHIKRLREGLALVNAGGLVETVRGVGYRFNASKET
ncbi:phosphate regulon transcriptional regulatory protein PhoB [Entomomonas moraniae]|uniref:Phosphate regulon transcriptional regulatory protein PhoB n=1 Tax=Entomomonas moraniae TaxID=2213226 RepID=A0A3S9XCY7_9GAMM|nr:phosphate regulon transcriptional regulator PhoB [Entomomonas moraniae]AZS50267.1 phosphate regulon transcriptional regulatory protein PhoB [Entomomonas moraniae]